MNKLDKPQLRPKVKPTVNNKKNYWAEIKAVLALTGLVALALRAVQLEADNEAFMLGAGIFLVTFLVICVGEVIFKNKD